MWGLNRIHIRLKHTSVQIQTHEYIGKLILFETIYAWIKMTAAIFIYFPNKKIIHLKNNILYIYMKETGVWKYLHF